MNDRAKTINQLAISIQQLKVNKKRLGFFARKAKRAIDDKVKELEESNGYNIQSMKNKYHIAPDQARETMAQMRKELALVNKQRHDMPAIQPMAEQQEEVELRYEECVTAAQLHPEAQRIMEATKSNVRSQGRQATFEELVQAGKERAAQMKVKAELEKGRSRDKDIRRDEFER